MARVRETLEDWFTRYPANHQASLRGEFRSKLESKHDAAFFELLLHELLRRRGCTVEVHPSVPGATTKPDFLVTPPSGEAFYLEATVVSDQSKEEAGREQLQHELEDALDGIDSPDFSFAVVTRDFPEGSRPIRSVVDRIRRGLPDLDYDVFMEKWPSLDLENGPRWRLDEPGWCQDGRGWEVDVYPVPRPPELRGTPNERPVFLRSAAEMVEVHPEVALKEALEDKSSKYGDLDRPFVIAVNYTGGLNIVEMEILNGLLGTRRLRVETGPDGHRTTPWRDSDGFWGYTGNPLHQGVSAVLMFNRAKPDNAATTRAAVFGHPWASRPVGLSMFGVDFWVPVDRGLRLTRGTLVHELLGLPQGWPFQDDVGGQSGPVGSQGGST